MIFLDKLLKKVYYLCGLCFTWHRVCPLVSVTASSPCLIPLLLQPKKKMLKSKNKDKGSQAFSGGCIAKVRPHFFTLLTWLTLAVALHAAWPCSSHPNSSSFLCLQVQTTLNFPFTTGWFTYQNLASTGTQTSTVTTIYVRGPQ